MISQKLFLTPFVNIGVYSDQVGGGCGASKQPRLLPKSLCLD